MRTDDFSSWLRDLLRPDLFKDYCPNGLCAEGSSQVNRVLTGVSFRMDLVQEAIRQKAAGQEYDTSGLGDILG